MPPVLYLNTAGNSTEEGGQLSNKVYTRASARLAAMIGKPADTNVAVSGSALLTDLTKTWAPASSTGGWVTAWRNHSAPARTRAPYLGPFQVGVLGHGINDIAMFGGVAGFLTAWERTMFALLAKWRCGAIFEDSDASVTYGSGWTTTTITTFNSGTTVKQAIANGSYFDFVVPAGYDGQALNLFFVGFGTGLTGITLAGPLSATITVTKAGTQVAQSDNATQAAGVNQGVAMPHCVRVATPDPSVYAGQTLRATITNLVGGYVYFDCWGIESDPAPLVILADALRAPSYATLYTGWPHTPTDAEIQALNTRNAVIAGLFSDSKVALDGMDAVFNKVGNWLNYVHPDERMDAIRAFARAQIVRQRMPPADLLKLGTP